MLLAMGTVITEGIVHAGVSDKCSDCHTMHNSQGGQPMNFNSEATPLPLLLRETCLGCHTGVNTGAASGFGAIPKVDSSPAAPTYIWGGGGNTLAGGNFWWVGFDDALGHNVAGVDTPDSRLTTPPGWNQGAAWSGQLKCAGTNGCHGNTGVADQILALESAHHSNVSAPPDLDGTTIGTSYRFLSGALGLEDPDWEYTLSSTDHNQYVGVVSRTESNAASPATISGQCARCHGNYHNSSGSGVNEISVNGDMASPWLRHPTDYAMPLTGEFSGYLNPYNPKVPLGRLTTELGALPDDVSSVNRRVIVCVSCHVAHGSPYKSMLRWNYRAWPGADPTLNNGCQLCHTAKG